MIDFEDADLTHEWVERYRIPLVTNPYPRWSYEVAVVIPGSGEFADLYCAVWPTEDEARVIGNYIGYRRDWYNESWQAGMLARALDVDSGTNTVVLIKQADRWGYRMRTWSVGPTFVFKATLSELLDHINTYGDHVYHRWAEWKSAHPVEVAS